MSIDKQGACFVLTILPDEMDTLRRMMDNYAYDVFGRSERFREKCLAIDIAWQIKNLGDNNEN